jgi:hypothetical protein
VSQPDKMGDFVQPGEVGEPFQLASHRGDELSR